MSPSSPNSNTNSCPLVESLPPEIHLFILTYLRAIDLSSLQKPAASLTPAPSLPTSSTTPPR
eukprot:6074214-Ditylum_brightwellii.AAC.1